MSTHLFASPGDFPETLCGLTAGWGTPLSAVYGRDFDRVNCPQCLAKLQMPPREIPTGTIQPHEVDTAYLVCCVIVCGLVLLIGLLVLP